MKRLFVGISLTLCFLCNIRSQTLLDSFSEIRSLINNGNIEKGDSLLNNIEYECIESNDVIINLLYNETKGWVLLMKSKYEECIPHIQETLKLYEKINPKPHYYLADFSMVGYAYEMLGDYKEAERFYRKALIKSYAVANRNYNFQTELYEKLAFIYEKLGEKVISDECKEKVNNKTFIRINYLNWMNSLWEEIYKYERLKKYNEVDDLYVTLIEGVRDNEEATSDTLLLLLQSRAINLIYNVGNSQKALSPLLEIVTTQDLHFPNRLVCSAYNNLAYCYARNGDYEKLEILTLIGREYLILANMEEYPSSLIYRYAGNGFLAMKDYDNAIKSYKQCLKESSKKEEKKLYESTTNELSGVYILMGRPRKAVYLLKKQLRRMEIQSIEAPSMHLYSEYHNLGRAYMLLGNISKALYYLNQSKEMQINLLGKVNERTQQYINECHNDE